jgi:hypothetical protein
LAKKAVSKVEFELNQIEQLFEAYRDLLKRANEESLDLIEVTALASVLHSFYNGLENIFLSIAKEIDLEVPTGSQWHRDLLTRMTETTSRRAAILTPETAHRLVAYLGFRHFYRHSYSFFLDWKEMEELVLPLEEIWKQVRSEILLFLRKLGLASE